MWRPDTQERIKSLTFTPLSLTLALCLHLLPKFAASSLSPDSAVLRTGRATAKRQLGVWLLSRQTPPDQPNTSNTIHAQYSKPLARTYCTQRRSIVRRGKDPETAKLGPVSGTASVRDGRDSGQLLQLTSQLRLWLLL